MTESADYPLYGSTFTLFRISPLYHGSTSFFNSLDTYARRLRETLSVDGARGAQVQGLLAGATNSGSLESCTWNTLGDENTWKRAQSVVSDGGEVVGLPMDEVRGIHVDIKYERAKHTAILLGQISSMSTTPGFTSMPLLLVRMPAPLREVFLNFLSTSFDIRPSPMRLRPAFLTRVVEKFVEYSTYPEDDESTVSNVDSLSKGIGMQLQFPSVAPLLRNLDLSIPKDDIHKFASQGQPLWQQLQIKRHANVTPDFRPQSAVTGPFTAALSTYLNTHIAMPLHNPSVVVSKVALGPFALAGEGKIKVSGTSAAAIEFWELLVQEARGAGLDGRTKNVQCPVTKTTVVPLLARTDDSIPTEPPPPYELHDPASQG